MDRIKVLREAKKICLRSEKLLESLEDATFDDDLKCYLEKIEEYKK